MEKEREDVLDEMMDSWSCLRLEEAENVNIDLEDVLEDIDPGGRPSLLGRLFTNKPYRKESLFAVMKSSWELEGWVRFKEILKGDYLIQFEKEEDSSMVMKGGPWLFSKSIFLLTEINTRMKPKDITFDSFQIWVHVYGLPTLGFNEHVGRRIGSRIGMVIEVDPKGRKAWKGSHRGDVYMRIRVSINTTSPLMRGLFVTVAKDEKTWVHFQYERLPIFCFSCGRIGHTSKECSDEINSEMDQFGEWLRAHSDVKHPCSGGNECLYHLNVHNHGARRRTRAVQYFHSRLGWCISRKRWTFLLKMRYSRVLIMG